MGQFVDGEWVDGWYSNDEDGKFERPPTDFRDKVEELHEEGFHLYVCLACPWAHRTLVARSVLGMEQQLPVSVVDWFLDDGGWAFKPDRDDATTKDKLFGYDRLRHVYKKADSNLTARVTVPVLWDLRRKTILNNESREILRMFTTTFKPWHKEGAPDLCPEHLQEEIDRVLDEIYEPINNGVYKAGFSSTQEAYDQAVDTLFEQLYRWDKHLAEHPYLVGDRFTEADICLFTTLYRFDPVYHTHFKCSKKMIAQMTHLQPYLERVYNYPGVAETCNLEHIRNHYYRSHTNINPTGIVAATPDPFSLQRRAVLA